MKRYRVKETFKVTGWTYVEAKDSQEAEDILSGGNADDLETELLSLPESTSVDFHDTHWDTLEVVDEED